MNDGMQHIMEVENGVQEQQAGDGTQSYRNYPTPTPAPAIEIKLFIGRVPQSMDENGLRPIFEEFGEVKEVVIIRDKANNKHKNSAFVKMAAICSGDAAIRGLNNTRILDQGMGAMTVKYATGEVERLGMSPLACEQGVDQAKLFVGSIPRTLSEEELRDFFAQYGGVEETFIMKDNATNQGRGCAFVKLAYKEQALHAIGALNAKHTFQGCSRPMEVRFAESKAQRAQQMMGGGPMAGSAVPVGRGMGRGNVGMGGPMGGIGMGGGGPGMGPATAPPSNNNPRACGQWKEYFTQDGRPYYHNEYTNVTTWDRPPEFMPMPPAAGYNSASTPMAGGSMGEEGKDQNGPPGANIFVFHVPNDWVQSDLINNFVQFGPIVSARVATDRSTGRNKGFAFVSFESVEAAGHAVATMNGFMAGGKRLKVTIKKGEEQHAARVSPMPFQQPGMGGAMRGGGGGPDGQWGGAYGGASAQGTSAYPQSSASYGQASAGGYGQGGGPQQRFAPY